MNARMIPLVFKQVARRRTRSLLTLMGVALAMFLFCAVQAMQRGVREATEASASDTLLVVYRENRYCPFTSRLPERYAGRIEKIPGVREVVPMQIVVNNCRASLDVVTFRGVPESGAESLAAGLRFVEGSLDSWRSRGDGALIGEELAARRGLHAGDSFDAAGITVFIAGVISSDAAQDRNVAYVALPFLQQSSRVGLGVVTQFNVRVQDPAESDRISKAIDDEFRTEAEPTSTRPEKAFVARAAGDVIQIVGFTRYLGWACLAAVLALVGNAIVLGVQDRIKEHAILQTLGFRSGLIARLIMAEGVLLSLLGGAVGALGAWAFLSWGRFAMTVDGVSIGVAADLGIVLIGLAISGALGVVAGIVPAIQASRREIVQCFRAV